jgi:HSP20 family protein
MAVLVRRPHSTGRAPQRWDPFSELEQLQARMAQLVEAGLPEDGLWTPLADIEETEDAWVVEAELPGVKREDVNVDVRDSEVVVTGEIKERERKGILRRRTRPVGRFEFRVTLPGDTDPERVDAKLADGVLTVRIPKPERARPHRVDVAAG